MLSHKTTKAGLAVSVAWLVLTHNEECPQAHDLEAFGKQFAMRNSTRNPDLMRFDD